MVHDSSDNVFEDMGMSDPDERLAKAELRRAIRGRIKVLSLTQSRAAEILNVDPLDVQDLTRGRLSRFSIERLERFRAMLDRETETGTPKAPPSRNE